MRASTTVTVYVPGTLRTTCAGAPRLQSDARSVRALLAEIERAHPMLYRSICDETGAVRRHVNLFVNTDHIRDRDGFDTVLEPGDDFTIVPAVSGG